MSQWRRSGDKSQCIPADPNAQGRRHPAVAYEWREATPPTRSRFGRRMGANERARAWASRGRHGTCCVLGVRGCRNRVRRGTPALDAGSGRNLFSSCNQARHTGSKAFLGFEEELCLAGLILPLSFSRETRRRFPRHVTVLLRHATPVPEEEDPARPLSAQGVKEAAFTAKGIAEYGGRWRNRHPGPRLQNQTAKMPGEKQSRRTPAVHQWVRPQRPPRFDGDGIHRRPAPQRRAPRRPGVVSLFRVRDSPQGRSQHYPGVGVAQRQGAGAADRGGGRRRPPRGAGGRAEGRDGAEGRPRGPRAPPLCLAQPCGAPRSSARSC
eukprot:gene14860-biopygen10492